MTMGGPRIFGPGRIAAWAALLALSSAIASPCLAQTDPGSEAMQALPEAAYEAARAAFEALPEPDRTAIQDALVWTGDYASTADGGFGRRTFEAIQAWQRRTRRPVDGILDRPSIAALVAAALGAKTSAGFAVVTDAASGIRIGIPQKLLPKHSPNQIGGTRYQSADERVTLDTRAQPGGAGDLQGLYERNLAIQTAGRTVTYRLLRPDFFVIAGETAGGRFYSRYAHEGGAIRGFSIGYDKALARDFDRLTVAIANSFQPFGPGKAPSGVMAEPASPPPRPGATEARPARGAGFTGLAVSPRKVVVPAASLEACPDPRIDGASARVVGKASGLAALEPAAARRTVALRFANAPAEGAGIVAFYAASEGGRAVVTPAEFVAGGRLVAPLQDGAAGGVVLDRSGAVAGMVGSIALNRRSVAGLVPPASYPFVGAAQVKEAAGEVQGAPGAGDGTGRGSPATAILPALVRIECQADRGASPAPAPSASQPPGIRMPPERPRL